MAFSLVRELTTGEDDEDEEAADDADVAPRIEFERCFCWAKVDILLVAQPFYWLGGE